MARLFGGGLEAWGARSRGDQERRRAVGPGPLVAGSTPCTTVVLYIYTYLHRLLIADCFCDGNHGVLALFSLSFSFSFASSWASSPFRMRFFSTYCLATSYYASSSIDRRTTDTKGIHLSARHYCSALSTSTMLHPTCALCTPFPPTLLTATDNGTMGHIPPCPPCLAPLMRGVLSLYPCTGKYLKYM